MQRESHLSSLGFTHFPGGNISRLIGFSVSIWCLEGIRITVKVNTTLKERKTDWFALELIE